jgi:starch synthase (maltosyl-transferring)
VKKKHAKSAFVAETLGCSITDVRETATSGFDMVCNSAKWWDYDGAWLLQQHDLIPYTVATLGFPENHDTERVYDGTEFSINIMKQRSLFTAFFSAAWLIPIGFEFGFSRRIRVTRTRVEDWEEANIDLREFIGRINKIKKHHAVLGEDGLVRVLRSPNPNILLLWKSTVNAAEEALLVLNKDIYNSQYFEAGNLGSYMQFAGELKDISPELSLGPVGLGYFSCQLGPGQALILVGGS